MTLPWALALAAFIFLVIKSLFALLGWYSRDGSDVLYRRHLDALVDKLETLTLFEVGHAYVQRWVLRVRGLLHTFKRPRLTIIGVFFCINLICFYLGMFIIRPLFDYVDFISPNVLTVGLGLTAGGVVFDILSIAVTWWLVKRAVASLKFFKMIGHILLDLFVAVIAIFWVFFLVTIITLAGEFTMADLSILYSSPQTLFILLGRIFFGEKNVYYMLRVLILIMGASAALPTLTYLVFLIPLVLFKLTPQWVHKIGSKMIYLVTTDQKPVLTQLGNVFGSLGAILTALLAVVMA